MGDARLMRKNDFGVMRFVDPAKAIRIQACFSEREQKVLDIVNQKIAARDSIEAVIDYLFESTRDISPCDRIGLAFVDDDGRLVSSYATASYEPLLMKAGYAEDLKNSSLEQVIERSWPRIIYDLEAYAQQHPDSASSRLLVREGVRSSLTCPLTVEGRSVGVLFRSARKSNAYDERQVGFHLAIAERLGQTIEKTRQIQRLADANRAYSEMLGFVSHELKSPLASIVTNARLMTEGYVGSLDEKQQELLRRMISSGEYLLGLIRDYLDLARLESHELRLASQRNLNFAHDVIRPAVDTIRTPLEAKSQRLVQEFDAASIDVEADPDLCRVVLINLLGNAVKYGFEGGEIRLRASRKDDSFRVSVWNEGPGFTEQERMRLFRKFSRLNSPTLRKEKGTGVGLYTVWRIIGLHGGRVWARSEPDAWAEFTFEIPQPLPVDESDALTGAASA